MAKKKSELASLREQIKEQRALLRRAQRWIGVAAGAIAAAVPSLSSGGVHSLHNDAANALELGGDISGCLEKYD
jgi:hypothetical protein